VIALGFDTSLTISGCARVDLAAGESGSLEAVRWETWRARASAPEVASVAASRRRIRLMLSEILSLVPVRFDLAVVEAASMGGKLQASLKDERAALRWMLIDQLLARGPVALVSPKTRALLGSGNGNAGKAEVLAAVRARVPGALVPDDNVADAVALAEAGVFALGGRVEYSAKQVSAHAKVAWPVDGAGSPAGKRDER